MCYVLCCSALLCSALLCSALFWSDLVWSGLVWSDLIWSCLVLSGLASPSGLQPVSMSLSGHSQDPVRGLKARPGSQGIPLAVTREQTPAPGPGGITDGRISSLSDWTGVSLSGAEPGPSWSLLNCCKISGLSRKYLKTFSSFNFRWFVARNFSDVATCLF